jgi:putative transposase
LQRTVVKCISLNLLPPTKSKKDILETSRQYLEAANNTLAILRSEKPSSANKLHRLSYNLIRSKYDLQAQLVQDARRDVWAKRKHKIEMFKTVPVTYNVPRSGNFGTTEQGNPVISISTVNGRTAIPIKQDGSYKRFQRFLDEGYKFTEFKLTRTRKGRSKNWIILVSLHKTFDVSNNSNVLGVDVGTKVLAAVSILDNGHIARQIYFGRDVSQVKRDIGVRRSILQNKSKKSDRARRALRKLRGYEANFTTTRCYQIAHEIVDLAVEYNASIAIENLKGLNGTKLRRKTDRKVKRMPYSEFRQALESVAFQNGVNVVAVSPRNTSKTCYLCGNISRSNRKTQALFSCVCSFEANADRVASVNIAIKASKLLMERGDKGSMQDSTPTSCLDLSQTQISMSRMPVTASLRFDESVSLVQHD